MKGVFVFALIMIVGALAETPSECI